MKLRKKYKYFLMNNDLKDGIPFLKNFLIARKEAADFRSLYNYLFWLKNINRIYLSVVNSTCESLSEFINRNYPLTRGGEK